MCGCAAASCMGSGPTLIQDWRRPQPRLVSTPSLGPSGLLRWSQGVWCPGVAALVAPIAQPSALRNVVIWTVGLDVSFELSSALNEVSYSKIMCKKRLAHLRKC